MRNLGSIKGKDYVEKLQNLGKIKFISIRGIRFRIDLEYQHPYWGLTLTIDSDEEYKTKYTGNIYMDIADNVRIGGHIQRGKYVTGKQLLSVMDDICIWLQLNSCFMNDESTNLCESQYINYKMLSLIADCQTYYEKNGFIQVHKHNDELWNKFIQIRETTILKLFSSNDLIRLKDLGYDDTITLANMFIDLKKRNCEIQGDVLDICNLSGYVYMGCNDFNTWTEDTCGNEDWYFTIRKISDMKSETVKHYINPQSINVYKLPIPDLIERLDAMFIMMYDKGFDYISGEKLLPINILGDNYLVIIKPYTIYVCKYYHNIQDIINGTQEPEVLLSLDNNGDYELFSDLQLLILEILS